MFKCMQLVFLPIIENTIDPFVLGPFMTHLQRRWSFVVREGIFIMTYGSGLSIYCQALIVLPSFVILRQFSICASHSVLHKSGCAGLGKCCGKGPHAL